MDWHLTTDLEVYAATAGPLLAGDPVRHNLLLTVIEHARQGTGSWTADPTFGWAVDDGAVVAAVSCTPPFNLVLSDMTDPAIASLVDTLVAAGVAPPGVFGPAGLAAQFAHLWCRRVGGRAELQHAERLHRLDRLIPAGAAGGGRPATEDEIGLLADWLRAFQDETRVVPVDAEGAVRHRIAAGAMLVWDDGGPVSMAGHAPPVAGVARVGPVYTPPERRRHGYGRALTAAVTARLLEAGNDCCVLFTDLANPTSNSIYRQIGYRPVIDVTQLRFLPPGGG